MDDLYKYAKALEDKNADLSMSFSSVASTSATTGDKMPSEQVLPFWDVLRDKKVKAAPIIAAEARRIYLLIVCAFLVDSLGFSYRFYDSLRVFQPLNWVIGPVLGLVFSFAFAIVAIGLVLKPLSEPRSTPVRALRMQDILSYYVLPGALLLFILFDQDLFHVFSGDKRANYYDAVSQMFFNFATFFFLLFGVAMVARAANSRFGGKTGLFLTARGLMLLAAGFLVAQPLHLLFFGKEIRDWMTAAKSNELQKVTSVAASEYERFGSRELAHCLMSHGLGGLEGCSHIEQELKDARLARNAAQLNVDDEIGGTKNLELREAMKKSANEAGAAEAAGYYGYPPSGKRTCGAQCDKWKNVLAEAERNYNRVREKETKCAAAMEECRKSVAGNSDLIKEKDELNKAVATEKRNAETFGTEGGYLAKGFALEEMGQDPKKGAAVRRDLALSWLIAMFLPAMIIVLKLTSSSRFDGFLRDRFGRDDDNK